MKCVVLLRKSSDRSNPAGLKGNEEGHLNTRALDYTSVT